MKYKFDGYVEYAPKDDREWHFERKKIDRVIESKNRKRAEVKLQLFLLSEVMAPVKRLSFEYECEEMNEMD